MCLNFGRMKQYTAYFAPWTAKVIKTAGDSRTSDEDPTLPPPFHTVAFAPQDATKVHELSYFGQSLHLRTPPVFPAACLSFSMRADNDSEVSGTFHGSNEVVSVPGSLPTLSGMPRRRQSNATAMRQNPSVHQNLTFRLNSRFETPLATLSSTAHDFNFHRLQACASSSKHPGLDISLLRGQFAGVWEGRFTFFDFDSYREMLGGRVRSLYEGPLRAQPQIWRIEEHIVEVTNDHPEGGKGSALSAGFERTWDEDRLDTANNIQRAVDPNAELDTNKRYEILLFGVVRCLSRTCLIDSLNLVFTSGPFSMGLLCPQRKSSNMGRAFLAS